MLVASEYGGEPVVVLLGGVEDVGVNVGVSLVFEREGGRGDVCGRVVEEGGGHYVFVLDVIWSLKWN